MSRRIAVLLLLLLVVAGCSKRTTSPVAPAGLSSLKLAPTDGATSVRLDAAVVVDFGSRVDASTVERGLHLVSETDMYASCPDSGMGAHGSMSSIMADPRMMAHMDSLHSVRGSFTWNQGYTVCTFTPDTLMRAQTRYMVHMSREMIDMMGQMGSGMGSGPMMPSGDMATHFTTTTADDHAGHH